MNRQMSEDSLPVPCLEQMHFMPCSCPESLSPAGQCFAPDPAAGDGYYWFYEKQGMFAMSVMDLRPKEDYIMEYRSPDFISVNYYDTISAEELSPYKRMSANCIRGHVSDGAVFRARFHKNMPIRGTELMLMPGYYHDYLETRYPGEFEDPKSSFKSIDGCTDFPELVLLLKQIGRFQGSGVSAHLYFESKVAEALSLIIERTRQHQTGAVLRELSEEDRMHLDAVRAYIEDHFAFEIRTEQLARMAYMGETKLRISFKQTYGLTITEYIRNRRMAHAEFLLLKTTFSVTQVAEAVGYHHAGRFSALFKQNTGLCPEEYRRMMR